VISGNIVLGEDWRKSNNEEILKQLPCIFYFMSQGIVVWFKTEDHDPWFLSRSIEVFFRIGR
jgi:hypothetical protein